MSSQHTETLTEDWLNVRDCGVSGSRFESRAVTQAGSNRIILEQPGDFMQGQGVMVSRCYVHYDNCRIRPAQSPYNEGRPVTNELAFRGYDAKDTHWTVFMLEIDGLTPLTFRWSDNLGISWRSEQVSHTGEWQELSHGVQVQFQACAWEIGHLITFHARDQLFTTIEAIDGNTLFLADQANVTTSDAVVRHMDGAALQTTIDRAVRERRNIHLPTGLYRLRQGLTVRDATAITIAGANAENTVLDISEGTGAIFGLIGGVEVTLRNLRLLGHTGVNESNPRGMQTSSGRGFYPMVLKYCQGMRVNGTERVFAENLHASRMSGECFYSQGPNREGIDLHTKQPNLVRCGYTRELTFLRCSVTDCNFNAFNNNDIAENTNILHCRIENIGGCSWEGPARFIRFIGNTIRNAGCCSIGNMGHRFAFLEKLGCGQSVFADNVFEGHHWHRTAIGVCAAATNVIIRNNIFVNYGGTAIDIKGLTPASTFPAEHVAVTGNIIDLTAVDGVAPICRAGIDISASNVIVSDNQIFVRGACDRKVSGIVIHEPAVNVTIHDNHICHCRTGIAARRVQSLVTDVIDNRTFMQYHPGLPLLWAYSHGYKGWHVVWKEGSTMTPSESIIKNFDPATCRFILTAPRNLRPGDSFEIYPDSANWAIHSNTIGSCQYPMDLDAYGSETSVIRDNIIDRGEAENVIAAIFVRGRFQILDNLLRGFDEPGSTAILSLPDRRHGGVNGRLYEGNRFVRCAASDSPLTSPLPPRPVWCVPKIAVSPHLNGAASDWAWDDPKRVIAFERDINGRPVQGLRARAIAGWSDQHLYVAAEFSIPSGAVLKAGPNWGKDDGMAMAFRNTSPEKRGPVWLLWGVFDGTFKISVAGGAAHEHLNAAKNATRYASHVSGNQWTCEWRLPLNAMKLDADDGRLQFNIGLRSGWEDTWIVWVPTGERVLFGWLPTHVDFAGDLRLLP